MIISIGLSLLVRYVFLYFFGGESRNFADYNAQAGVQYGPFLIAPKNLVADGIALVVLAAVSFALVGTRLGKATRAVADNPALAAASGINVDRIIRLVWTIGGGLAALSGVILGALPGRRLPDGLPDPAADLRGGDPRRLRHGLGRAARQPGHRARSSRSPRCGSRPS